MKALFVETKAYRQCLRYAELCGLPPEEVAAKAYENSRRNRERDGFNHDDWWISLALGKHDHTGLDVNGLFNWANSPEGRDFWMQVHRCRG